jgi:nucleoid-associated protein YejK
VRISLYISISKKPSKEEIATFNMKIVEADAVIDYRIELASLDQAVKKQFCEYYNLAQEKSENLSRVTLSYNNEV